MMIRLTLAQQWVGVHFCWKGLGGIWPFVFISPYELLQSILHPARVQLYEACARLIPVKRCQCAGSNILFVLE